MFKQVILDGWQIEHPDNWLARHDPWEIHRVPDQVEIQLNCSFEVREGTLRAVAGKPSRLHLPAAGEIVLFDRSWYNRAGVERVMGFCTPEEYEEFYRSVPEFERMLVRSGIRLLKYWFSITDEEQYVRFLGRIHDPLKQWKLSPMDLESRRRWEDYTKAKEVMLERSHIPEAKWWVVHAVDKKLARLNCIHHLLEQFPYQEVIKPAYVLPAREHHEHYSRQALSDEMLVPEVY
jgi:hypothetical protein